MQRRYRGLTSLTTADRYIVNQIADNQAQIEVAYAMAHALTDLEPPGGGAALRRPGPRRPRIRCWATYGRCRWPRPRARWPAPPTSADRRPAAPDPVAAVLRLAAHRDRHRVLDRPHGGPSDDPARRGRGAVRRRRPAPGPARRDADRAGAAVPGDGRHGRPAANGGGRGGRRGEPDRQQRERLLRHERGARREQRRDLDRHGQDRVQRRAAGEGDGEGRRPAPQPAADRRGQRRGGHPRGRSSAGGSRSWPPSIRPTSPPPGRPCSTSARWSAPPPAR